MDSPRRTFQSSGWTFQVELVTLYLESCFTSLESIPERIATDFSKTHQVFGLCGRPVVEGSIEMSQWGVHSIELDELYLESCFSALESVSGRIATGFPENDEVFAVFFRVFKVFWYFWKVLRKSEGCISIELVELYLESSTATLESSPGRIHPENTRILT